MSVKVHFLANPWHFWTAENRLGTILRKAQRRTRIVAKEGVYLIETHEIDTIFAALRKEHENIVIDGLVDKEKYQSASVKNAYVLKEVNGGGNWDLRSYLNDGGRAQTWDVVARWTEAILDPDQSKD